MKILSKTSHKIEEICNTKLHAKLNGLKQVFKAMENTLVQKYKN